MGCDIHGWVERKVGDRWVAVSEFNDAAGVRNYPRFARLASVRGDGPEARGVPDDVAETTKYHIDRWSGDGHSHSWMSVPEAVSIFKDTAWQPDEYVARWPLSAFFEIESVDPGEYRIVFWFDN